MPLKEYDILSYRKKECELFAQLLHGCMQGNKSSEYMMGLCDAINKVVQLPNKLAKNDEAKKRAAVMVKHDFEQWKTETMKRIIFDE